MRNYILSTVILLSGISLTAQHYDGSIAWLNTDTVISDKALTGRHALLEVKWHHTARGISYLSEDLSILQDEFPWLNIVLNHTALSDKDLSPTIIKYYGDLYNLDCVIRLDTASSSIDKNSEYVNLGYTLTHPDGTVIQSDLGWTLANRKNMTDALSELAQSYNRPGKTLGQSFLYSPSKNITQYRLLDHPQGLIYDDRYRRFFIADSGNDRVIVSDENGQIYECIGGVITGTDIGSFDMTALSNPTAMAYHVESDKLYISDMGNKRIIIADINNRNTEELSLLDEDGYEIGLPTGASDLDIYQNILTISLPAAKAVWIVDLTSSRLTSVIGNADEAPGFTKKTAKLAFANPTRALNTDEGVYVLDQSLQTIYRCADGRTSPIYTKTYDTWKDGGGVLDSLAWHISDMVYQEGELLLFDDRHSSMTTIDLENQVSTSSPIIEESDINFTQGFTSSDEYSYILDVDRGEIIQYGNGIVDRLRLTEINRLQNSRDIERLFLSVLPVSIADSVQSSIKISLDLPEGMALHPQHESLIMKTAGTEAYIQNDKLSKGAIEFTLLGDFKRNQVNFMGDLILTDIGSPWRIYFVPIQISIPITKDGKGQTAHEFVIDISERFNGAH